MAEEIGLGEIKTRYYDAVNRYQANPNDPVVNEYMVKTGLSPKEMNNAYLANQRILKNPDDKNAIATRNAMFTKVSDAMPAESVHWWKNMGYPGGAGFTARTLMNYTIDNNPELKAEYLRKKGFIVNVKGDEIYVRKPDEIGFKPVDPSSGFDLFELTDAVDDIAQGLVEGAKISAKYGGATTGVGLPLGIATAGSLGAGFEGARQALGKAVGTRDEYDFQQMAKEGIISATFGGAQLGLGVGLKGISSGSGKLLGIMERFKPNAEQIKQAANNLGLGLLPGQISESKLIQYLTEAQYRSSAMLSPYAIKARKVIDDSYDKIRKELTAMLGERTGDPLWLSGTKAFEAVNNLVKAKKDAAKTWYEAATDNNFYKNANIDTSTLNAELDLLKDKYQGASTALSLIDKYQKSLEGISKIRGLTNLKSEIGDEIRVKQGAVSGTELSAIKDIGDLIKANFDENFEMFLQKSRSGEWKTKPEEIIKAKTAKEIGDRLWSDLYDDLATLVKRPGKDVRGGPETIIDKFIADTPAERFVDKVFKSNDWEKIVETKKRFPEAFEALRKSKLDQFYQKWAPNEGTLDLEKAMKELKQLTPDMKNIIFGKDADKKIKDLSLIYESIPKDMNPSKTAIAIKNFFSGVPGEASWISFTNGMLLNLSKSSSDLGQGLLFNLGKTIEGKKMLQAVGIGRQATKGILPGYSGPEYNYQLIPQEQQ